MRLQINKLIQRHLAMEAFNLYIQMAISGKLCPLGPYQRGNIMSTPDSQTHSLFPGIFVSQNRDKL